MKIGLVMAAWNAARTIEYAIKSVVYQTATNWTLVIVNDGSTDGSAQLADRYIQARYKQWGHRIFGLWLEHGGLAQAVNAGAQFLARTPNAPETIGCLAADDLLDKTYVEEITTALEAHPMAPCAYSRVGEFGDRTGFWDPGDYRVGVLAHKNIVPGCAVWRRRVWDKLHGFDERFRYGLEDWHLAARAEAEGYVGPFSKPVFVPTTTYWHRAHKASLSARMSPDYETWAKQQIAALFPAAAQQLPDAPLVTPTAVGPIVRGPFALYPEET